MNKTTPTNQQANYLTVLQQNGLCSIQDLGRPAAQHLGFTTGGAADEYAYLAANYLVNNHLLSNRTQTQPCAALEITLGQISFQAHQACSIAITGADCNVTINQKPIKNWQTYPLKTNDVLYFKAPKKGLHSYLAVHGGIQSKTWLHSQSQSFTEQALGFGEDAISLGSRIALAELCIAQDETRISKSTLSNAFYSSESAKTFNQPLRLRFIPQPLWLQLNQQQQSQFLHNTFNISPDSNRMGYRLSNIPQEIEECLLKQASLLSKPVTYGTIQLPSNGQPIVLMKERQTIGGYPVLGCVIQTDLFRLSQLRPGEAVRFIPTTLTFAQQQLYALHQRFSGAHNQ